MNLTGGRIGGYKPNRHRQSPNDITVGPDSGLRADNTQFPVVRDIWCRGHNGMINIKFIWRVNHWTPQPLCIQSRCTLYTPYNICVLRTEVNNTLACIPRLRTLNPKALTVPNFYVLVAYLSIERFSCASFSFLAFLFLLVIFI